MEELIQAYIPFLGVKRRNNKFKDPKKTGSATKKTTYDAIVDLANEKKKKVRIIEKPKSKNRTATID